MKDIIQFELLTPALFQTYIEVGTKAYNQHYVHLWPNENTSPYLNSSFTETILKIEQANANTFLYVVKRSGNPVGILKFTQDKKLDYHSAQEALYIDKIYILKEHSGKGIGKTILHFAFLRAKENGKKIVWLDSMQKGPALHFYLKNSFEIHSETQVHFKAVKDEERPMYILVKKI